MDCLRAISNRSHTFQESGQRKPGLRGGKHSVEKGAISLEELY